VPPDLSAREREIVLQADAGLTDKEIAHELGLSVASVRTYWERLRNKLDANNRGHAIALALRGIVLEQERRDFERSSLIQMIVENTTDYAIFAMNLDCEMVTWNIGVERLFGYVEKEFLKLSTADIFTEEDRRHGVPDLECSTAARDGRAEDERWHLKKDGTLFYGSGVMVPLKDPAGKHWGYGKIVRDYTALRNLVDKALSRMQR
jgi:PAS domain S-box-containing protein